MNLQKEKQSLFEEYKSLLSENRISELFFANENRAINILSVLGTLYSSLTNDYEKAKILFEAILKIDPTNFCAFSNLSHIENCLRNFDLAISHCDKAILYSNRSSYEAFYNKGVILLNTNKCKEATEMLKYALSIDPNNPDARYNLGLSILKDKLSQDGWDHYDWRFIANKNCNVFISRCKSIWNGQDLKDKTLFIFNEQGLGDFIFFARFLPEIRKKGCKILCEITKNLQPIVGDLLLEHEMLFRENSGILPELPECDYQTSLCSLPRFLQIDNENKIPNEPYIKIPNKDRPEFFSLNNKNVGLCWFGNSDHKNDYLRSMPILNFKPILETENVEFFGIGKKENKKRIWPKGEVDLNERIESLKITNLDEKIRDFGDLAHYVNHLDLVITVDTAVAHLSAAMGKTTWMILGEGSDFRWKENINHSPWYPTMKIFRYQESWEKTIENVKKDFLEFLHRKI